GRSRQRPFDAFEAHTRLGGQPCASFGSRLRTVLFAALRLRRIPLRRSRAAALPDETHGQHGATDCHAHEERTPRSLHRKEVDCDVESEHDSQAQDQCKQESHITIVPSHGPTAGKWGDLRAASVPARCGSHESESTRAPHDPVSWVTMESWISTPRTPPPAMTKSWPASQTTHPASGSSRQRTSSIGSPSRHGPSTTRMPRSTGGTPTASSTSATTPSTGTSRTAAGIRPPSSTTHP